MQGICLLPPTDFVVLCDRVLPGEQVIAEITEVKKGHAEARKLRTLQPHRHAAEPRCRHFGPCGGCSFQNFDYRQQLAAKQEQVQQAVQRVGKVRQWLAITSHGFSILARPGNCLNNRWHKCTIHCFNLTAHLAHRRICRRLLLSPHPLCCRYCLPLMTNVPCCGP